MKRIWAAILVGGTAMAASAATTFSELQGEIAAAEPGATVVVENDIAYDGELYVPKSVVLSSPAGQTNVLTRAPGYAAGRLFRFAEDVPEGETVTLTVRDLVVDGNKAAGTVTESLVDVKSRHALTLDAGATVRNYYNNWQPGTINVFGTGVATMRPGAAVRDCENNHYGTAFRIGSQEKSNTDGTLNMLGGEITGCVDHHAAAARDWGGAVYVYGGKFNFLGGRITGNVSEHCVAGVVVFVGRMNVRNDGRIVGNTGGTVDDVSLVSESKGYNWLCEMLLTGDYTGEMTIRLFDGRDTAGSYSCRIWHSAVDGKYPRYAGTANIRVQGTNLHLDGMNLGEGYYPVMSDAVPVARTTCFNVYDFSTLKDLLQSNDVVTLYADWPMLTNGYFAQKGGTDLTVRSAPGERHVITREHSGTESYWWIPQNAKLRLENVIVDGRAESYCCEDDASWTGLLVLSEGAELYLDAGAEIRNARGRTGSATAGVHLVREGAYLEMNPGSSIHGMTADGPDAYGAAVRVNNGRFRMNGGVISNCVCNTVGRGLDYGGAVYLNGGTMELFGGLVTGNSAAGSRPAGVEVYNGACQISGDMQIRDNAGDYPDLYVCPERNDTRPSAQMVGAFRGKVGVSSGNTTRDMQIGVSYAEGATGAWNFFASYGSRSVGDWIGYSWAQYHQIYWGKAGGWVDGIGYDDRYECDPQALVPTAIDVDAERAALPHTFRGAACAFGGTVAVSFDEPALAAYFAQGGQPIRLLAGVEGPLTGAWTFALPEGCAENWDIKTVRGADGVLAYDLLWRDPGMVLLVR